MPPRRRSTGRATSVLTQVSPVAVSSLPLNDDLETFLAIDWLCDRSHSTYETPLEEEINQLRSEFDRRREEMDSRSSLEDTEERVSDEDDGDEIDLGDQDPELSQL